MGDTTRQPVLEETLGDAPTTHEKLLAWVAEVSELTQPDSVYWVDGSEEEYARLTDGLVEAGTLQRLNPELFPNSFVGSPTPRTWPALKSGPSSAPRTKPTPGSPTTGWTRRDEGDPHGTLRRQHARTHHVRDPVRHGSAGRRGAASSGSRSPTRAYVVASMHIMARIGTDVLRKIDGDERVLRPGAALRRCAAGARRGGRRLAVQRGEVDCRTSPRSAYLVLRLRLRRQRAAGQEVLRPAHRLGDGP